MNQRFDELRSQAWSKHPGEHVLIGENEEVVVHGKNPGKLLADYYAANPGKVGGFLLHIEPEGMLTRPRCHSRPRGRRP